MDYKENSTIEAGEPLVWLIGVHAYVSGSSKEHVPHSHRELLSLADNFGNQLVDLYYKKMGSKDSDE